MQMNRLVSIKAIQIALIYGYTKAHSISKSINDKTKKEETCIVNSGWNPANKVAKKCPQTTVEELIQIQDAIDRGLVEIPQREISKKEASIINTQILRALENEKRH
ncbi:hypothetical protein LJB88_04980 [Erysipelotrichaceae bacterium OttesenSCG-928-M19]|nr:hypothetical protein [Erysipelotrichaceae bacterium OttesenSCG-928-M19]